MFAQQRYHHRPAFDFAASECAWSNWLRHSKPTRRSRAAPGETAVPGESMTSLGTGHGRRTRRAKRVPFSGNEPDRGVRLYVQDVEGGTPKAITPEGMHATAFLVSHDGQSVAGIGPDQLGYIYPTAEGDGRPIRGMEMGEQPIAWSQDGLSLFIYRPRALPAKISRLDLASGRKTPMEQLMPGDHAGVETIGPILLTSDGKTCVCGYHMTLSGLYVVEGLK